MIVSNVNIHNGTWHWLYISSISLSECTPMSWNYTVNWTVIAWLFLYILDGSCMFCGTRRPNPPMYYCGNNPGNTRRSRRQAADSGYLVVSRIPSMNRYVCNGFEVSFKDSERKETWIAFRDAHHDAIEISHRFSIGSGRTPFGACRILGGYEDHWRVFVVPP